MPALRRIFHGYASGAGGPSGFGKMGLFAGEHVYVQAKLPRVPTNTFAAESPSCSTTWQLVAGDQLLCQEPTFTTFFAAICIVICGNPHTIQTRIRVVFFALIATFSTFFAVTMTLAEALGDPPLEGGLRDDPNSNRLPFSGSRRSNHLSGWDGIT